MSNALQEKAMLVNLSVSCWTASKKDNKAGESVKAQAAAAAKAGWFNKRLVDPVALQPISKLEGRIRDFHYKFTLAWSDSGDRVLPGAAYMDYMDGLRGLKNEFDGAVTQFVRDYPQLVQNARTMLGQMYDPGDYPAPASIAQRFAVKTTFSPVPDAADFRVDVGQEAIEEIKKNITAAVESRLAGATRECWTRLDEVVAAMFVKLSDPEAVFRDTLVENIRTLAAILPKLNITGDADLSRILTKVREHLLVHPDDLRKSKKLRAATAERAADILTEIGPWIATAPTPMP